MKKEVEEKITALRETKDKETDKSVIESKTAELSVAMQKIGEAMSKANADTEASKEGDAPKPEGDGEVHDAEAEKA